MSELQLSLTTAAAGGKLELVDGELVASAEPAVLPAILSPSPPPVPSALEERNLFGDAERIAARAASASTRRQYAAIFRAFGDWLTGALGRPPVVGDLDADVIALWPAPGDGRRAWRPPGGASDGAGVSVDGSGARP